MHAHVSHTAVEVVVLSKANAQRLVICQWRSPGTVRSCQADSATCIAVYVESEFVRFPHSGHVPPAGGKGVVVGHVRTGGPARRRGPTVAYRRRAYPQKLPSTTPAGILRPAWCPTVPYWSRWRRPRSDRRLPGAASPRRACRCKLPSPSLPTLLPGGPRSPRSLCRPNGRRCRWARYRRRVHPGRRRTSIPG